MVNTATIRFMITKAASKITNMKNITAAIYVNLSTPSFSNFMNISSHPSCKKQIKKTDVRLDFFSSEIYLSNANKNCVHS